MRWFAWEQAHLFNEAEVLKYANKALLAENKVKKMEMAMFVKLKNLLNAEQIAYLEASAAEK